MTHAPSTGQSSTHCSGGGDVVEPCVNRRSSLTSARRSARRPCVERIGASPSRQTFRQLSIAPPPSRRAGFAVAFPFGPPVGPAKQSISSIHNISIYMFSRRASDYGRVFEIMIDLGRLFY